MTKVSVIITTYKRPAEVIERAIISVLNQTYTNLEVLLIDDNVDERYIEQNRKLIERISTKDNRVSYYMNGFNHGACGCRNYGISKSQGKILAFLDDDDEFTADKLCKMVPMLNEEVEFVYCGHSVFRDNTLVRHNLCKTDDSLENLLCSNYIGGCSVPIFTKRLCVEVGGFDEAFPSCQDIDLWIRLFLKTKFKYVNEPLIKYHIMDEAITRSYERRLAGWQRLLSKYQEYYNRYERAADSIYNQIIEVYIQDKKFEMAYKLYLKRYGKNAKRFIKYLLVVVKAGLKILLNKIRGYN